MKTRFSFIMITLWTLVQVTARDRGVEVYIFDSTLLCHTLVPVGPVPPVFDPDGIYPYMSYCETSGRPSPRVLHFIALENRFLRVTVCPDLGGRISSIRHRPSGREVLYNPGVIRHTRILPRFYFVAGGIETSFPVSHSPTQNDRVLYRVDTTGERIYVTCGERELRSGMQWSVEYSLGPEDRFLTQRVRFHNPGTRAYPWMSWSNAAIASAPDTEFHFPGGPVLAHSSILDTVDWYSQGPCREKDIKEMTGYFWLDPEVNAFGVYTPSRMIGLYHVADPAVAPGIKLWSYGTGQDRSWATLSTAEDQPYVEIQGGPVRDQSIRLDLNPGQSITRTEFWLPSDRPLRIDSLDLPGPVLRPESAIPFFTWARPDEILPWLRLEESFISGGSPPSPPPPETPCWPPSGMEELGKALEWAVRQGEPGDRDTWTYLYGTWLAGRGEQEAAGKVLSGSSLGLSRVVQARLQMAQGQPGEAVELFRGIREEWVRNHPQVVVERDIALRAAGKKTLPERKDLLDRVTALDDDWIVERKVQLLIDEGNPAVAKELLLSRDFQKVHQRYVRTGLWMQICESLHIPFLPLPEQLGEDRLAQFGAYREYEGTERE